MPAIFTTYQYAGTVISVGRVADSGSAIGIPLAKGYSAFNQIAECVGGNFVEASVAELPKRTVPENLGFHVLVAGAFENPVQERHENAGPGNAACH